MHRLTLAAATLAFFLNPGLGCSGPEADYEYGEADMKAAVEGTWVLTLAASTGSTNEEITLQVVESSKALPDKAQALERRPFIRSAAACGTRTFVASAHACVDSTQMPLDVTVVSGPDSYRGAASSGELTVNTLIFREGQFTVSLGSLQIAASVGPDGTTQRLYGGRTDGSVVSVVSLVRTAK